MLGLRIKTNCLRVSFYAGVVELNIAPLADLLLVAIPVITLGASDASAHGVVAFATALGEDVFEEFIVDPCDCCLMASASASFHDMPQLCL